MPARAPNIIDRGEWFTAASIDRAIWSWNWQLQMRASFFFFRNIWTPVIGERISEIILHQKQAYVSRDSNKWHKSPKTIPTNLIRDARSPSRTQRIDLILADFNLVAGWSIRQTAKFNSPPRSPAIWYYNGYYDNTVYMYMHMCTYHVRCFWEANGHPALCPSLQSEIKVAVVLTVGVDSKKEITSTTGLITALGVAQRNPIAWRNLHSE